MKGLKAFIIIVGVIAFMGCSSQAIKTHGVFERQGVTYSELDASLEELKESAHDSKTQTQYRTAKALRHITKYFTDPGKRELAVRGLVFHAAFSSDNTVINSCEDRLESIIGNTNNDPALVMSVLHYKKEIVTGELGWGESSSSMFSGDITEYFTVADEGDREDALQFLFDRFDSQPLYLQYFIVKAFSEIAKLEPVCLELTNEGCQDSDEDDQADLKEELWDGLDDLMNETDVAPLLKTAIIRIALETGAIMDEDSKETWLQYWSTQFDIGEDASAMVLAALNKSNGYYPGIGNEKEVEVAPAESTQTGVDVEAMESGADEVQSQVTTKVVTDTFNPSTVYLDLAAKPNNDFWFNNASAILENQLFNKDYKSAKTENRVVPYEWASYSFDENDPNSIELREIIFYNINKSLRLGYRLTKAEKLETDLPRWIEATQGNSDLIAEQTLTLASLAYDTLQSGNRNAQPMLDALSNAVQNATDLGRQRLFLNAIIQGTHSNRSSVEAIACPILETTDAVTKYKAQKVVYDLLMGKAKTDAPAAQEGMAAEEVVLSNGIFCGEDLAAIFASKKVVEPMAEEPQVEEPQVEEPQVEEPAEETQVPAEEMQAQPDEKAPETEAITEEAAPAATETTEE